MDSRLPIAVLTDSYKAGHPLMYPNAQEMVAYGEFRSPMKGMADDRMVFYGLRYIIETYLHRRWTEADIDQAALFYKTHNAGGTAYPYPDALFRKFVRENDGYFPIKVEALPEGSCVHVRTPVYQLTASAEYSQLVTFMETLFTHVWYPSTVATLSRRVKDLVGTAFDKSVDEDQMWLITSRLHDFGMRGCTSLEQTVIGGCAHLLNFTGSDTMSAAYYAQFELNNGKPVAESIPATEHSVMTSWPSEEDAIQNMIKHFGSGVFAVVMDSYDYSNALYNVLPKIVEDKVKAGGVMVLRPDSGDPVEAVLMGLDAADKAFGHTVNKKGFKVIKNASVIQGDGIDILVVEKILDAVLAKGYAASNVAFGMGGGLLQKVNRDTMSFATKLSYIRYADGREEDVMKTPKTDSGKFSLPGKLQVRRQADGSATIFPAQATQPTPGQPLLKVVYDCRPVPNAFPDSFDQVRDRVNREWKALPRSGNPIGPELTTKIEKILKARK